MRQTLPVSDSGSVLIVCLVFGGRRIAKEMRDFEIMFPGSHFDLLALAHETKCKRSMVKTIALIGCLMAIPSCTGEPSLHKAAAKGDIATVQAILRNGEGVDDRATVLVPGVTPLMQAALNGHAETARILIKHGADVNARESQGHTPLMMAAQRGHTDTVRVLLEEGADTNAHHPLGITALMYAAANNHFETVDLLLDKGADVHAKSALGETALIKALKHGNGDIKMIKLLVAKGADINAETTDGKTALSLAIENNRTEAVTFLEKAGARR